jgi:hypothetical protein
MIATVARIEVLGPSTPLGISARDSDAAQTPQLSWIGKGTPVVRARLLAILRGRVPRKNQVPGAGGGLSAAGSW